MHKSAYALLLTNIMPLLSILISRYKVFDYSLTFEPSPPPPPPPLDFSPLPTFATLSFETRA